VLKYSLSSTEAFVTVFGSGSLDLLGFVIFGFSSTAFSGFASLSNISISALNFSNSDSSSSCGLLFERLVLREDCDEERFDRSFTRRTDSLCRLVDICEAFIIESSLRACSTAAMESLYARLSASSSRIRCSISSLLDSSFCSTASGRSTTTSAADGSTFSSSSAVPTKTPPRSSTKGRTIIGSAYLGCLANFEKSILPIISSVYLVKYYFVVNITLSTFSGGLITDSSNFP